MQNRWTAWLVGHPVFHSAHKLHHRNNSLHRPGKEFRERSGVCDWFDSARNYLLPDSGVRQRAISRTGRRRFGTENGAAGSVDEFRGSRSIAIQAVGWAGVSPAERRTHEPGKMPVAPLAGSLRYDFTQFGLRFSLKAAMPSRASSDSRACM